MGRTDLPQRIAGPYSGLLAIDMLKIGFDCGSLGKLAEHRILALNRWSIESADCRLAGVKLTLSLPDLRAPALADYSWPGTVKEAKDA